MAACYCTPARVCDNCFSRYMDRLDSSLPVAAGVRFVLADGKVDGRTVAVVPGQPCRVVRS